MVFSVVTTSALALLFGSKMFIIVFQPEKNTTEVFNDNNKSSFGAFGMKRLSQSGELASGFDLMNMTNVNFFLFFLFSFDPNKLFNVCFFLQ